MTTEEIAKENNLDYVQFDDFLEKAGAKYRIRPGKREFLDDVPTWVEKYKKYEVERKKQEEEEYAKTHVDEIEKEKKLSSILITSGFNFDGYKVIKYSGYISGDAVTQVDRGSAVSLKVFGINFGTYGGTNVGTALENALVTIRRQALLELKEKAYDLGCNAIIGVDFDYITLDPETASTGGGTVYMPYVFCVTANGNAVIIEKEQ